MYIFFKSVPEFPNYQVSHTGKIRNVKTQRYLKGKVDKDGYIEINLLNKVGSERNKVWYVRLHRLVASAWKENPENKPLVDHIDGKKDNNHISNLRWATHSENNWNSKKTKRNTKTNVRGIAFENNRYRVRIRIDKKYINFGSFKTLDEAIDARIEAVKKLYKEFAHPDEGKMITSN